MDISIALQKAALLSIQILILLSNISSLPIPIPHKEQSRAPNKKALTIPPHIKSNQNLNAQILIHLAHNLDRVSDRQVRIAVQVRGHDAVAVDGRLVAAQLCYLAYDADGAVGEGVEVG